MGWNITHRVFPSVIRYTRLARSDLARRGAIIPLYRKATWDQAAVLPEGTLAI
jgi:hypothetical protein